MKRIVYLLVLILLLSSCGQRLPKEAASGLYRVNIGYDDFSLLEEKVNKLGGEIILQVAELEQVEVEFLSQEARAQAIQKLKIQPYTRFIESATSRSIFPPIVQVSSVKVEGPGWHQDNLHLSQAWEKFKGKGTVVAISDSFIDINHPDLKGRFVTGYDALEGKEIKINSDLEAGDHGTHVAGIVAAEGNAVGIAPETKLMPLRIFAPNYAGDVSVAKALVWAVDHGADIINMSWGGPLYSISLAEALNYALSKNVILVAAAGNEGISSISYPAAHPGVIAVGATNPYGNLTWFSNYGRYVRIGAPGNRIFSSLPDKDYAFWDGTSMATPVVSGIAALLRQEDANIDSYQVLSRLIAGGQSHKRWTTVDALGAVNAKTGEKAACLQLIVQESDKSGARLADIYLRNKDSNWRYWIKADTSGRAAFWGLKPGLYELSVAGPETPRIDPEDRVVVRKELELTSECTFSEIIELKTAFKASLTWQNNDLDLAIKEGNWNWISSKDNAKFGNFSEDVKTGGEENYSFTGGISETPLKIGVYNRSDSEIKAKLRIIENGHESNFEITVPVTTDAPYEVDEIYVLGN